MSGNIGEKARAAFLALIMVTSVMAAGVAFTGSAAALEDPANEDEYGSLAVTGSTADGGENGVNLRATAISNGDVTGNLDEINISFGQDVNADGLSTGDVSVEVINTDGSSAGTATGGNGNTGETTDTADFTDVTNIDKDNTIALGDGKIIRLSISGTAINLPSDDLDATIGVKNKSGASATTDVTLQLNPGPVQVEGGNSYSTLNDALGDGAIDDEANTITVSDGLYDEAGSRLGDVSNDDVTIEAADGANPKVIFSGSPIGSSVFTASGDDVTVSGLDVELYSTDGPTDHLVRLDGANATLDSNTFNLSAAGGDENSESFVRLSGNNAQLQSNTFVDNYDGSNQEGVYAVQGSTGDTTDGVSIDGNTFDTNAGVYISGTNYTVSDNVLNVSGNYGVTTSDSGNNPVDNAVISGNEIYGVTDGGSSDLDAIRLFDGDNMTIENNVIDGQSQEFDQGIVLASGGDAADFTGGSTGGQALGNVSVTANEVYNVSTNGVYVVDSGNWLDGSPGDVTLDISELTVDNVGASGSPTANGINIDAGSDNLRAVEISGSSINSTNVGINTQDMSGGDVPATHLNVSGTSVDNTASGSQAIDLVNPDADVNIDSGTSIDQAGTGISIDADANHNIDITNIEVNGTSSGVDITDVTDSSGMAVNVTDSTFTNNDAAGLNLTSVTGGATDTRLNVHFNTFESNSVGVGVNDASLDGVFNVTFNDFVENDNAGLEVPADIAGGGGGVVNANYSWWGDRDYSRIVGPYTPQNAESQLPNPRRVYSYTRLHTGGQP